MEKYHLIITSLAQSDIAECVRFVLRVSKDAAITLANDIYRAINSLKTFPEKNLFLKCLKLSLLSLENIL